jgi:predicted AAA+ superfamily ATPase
MFSRHLEPVLAASAKSVLLLGPRQTGKSTLMAGLEPDLVVNLAHEATYLDFARNPRELEERIDGLPRATRRRTVLIDEVQRLPSLLNTVQALLDERGTRLKFLLTGSSARKLRRGGANLLPGRIHTYRLGPIAAGECGYALDTAAALATGTLPGILSDAEAASRKKTLRSYAATYLREEIQAESLTRNLEGFARFLHVAGEWSGHHLDLSKLAAAAQVARQSVTRYFEILEDTLIVLRADSFARSPRRRLVQHPKFFFFDVGVRNGLLGNFETSADRVGALFEHLVFSQLVAGAAATDQDIQISSFRTEHGAEVDFVVEIAGRVWALEVKASRNVGPTDLRGLRAFADYHGKRHAARVLYLGDAKRKVDGVDVVPWQEGLREMGL